jgi:hypothetical protein
MVVSLLIGQLLLQSQGAGDLDLDLRSHEAIRVYFDYFRKTNCEEISAKDVRHHMMTYSSAAFSAEEVTIFALLIDILFS